MLTGKPTCKIINVDSSLAPKNIKSKFITDLSIKDETIKLLEENIEINIYDLVLSNGFLQMTKEKID